MWSTLGKQTAQAKEVYCVTILEVTYCHTWYSLLHCARLFYMNNVHCNFLPVVGTPVCVTIKMQKKLLRS